MGKEKPKLIQTVAVKDSNGNDWIIVPSRNGVQSLVSAGVPVLGRALRTSVVPAVNSLLRRTNMKLDKPKNWDEAADRAIERVTNLGVLPKSGVVRKGTNKIAFAWRSKNENFGTAIVRLEQVAAQLSLRVKPKITSAVIRKKDGSVVKSREERLINQGLAYRRWEVRAECVFDPTLPLVQEPGKAIGMQTRVGGTILSFQRFDTNENWLGAPFVQFRMSVYNGNDNEGPVEGTVLGSVDIPLDPKNREELNKFLLYIAGVLTHTK